MMNEGDFKNQLKQLGKAAKAERLEQERQQAARKKAAAPDISFRQAMRDVVPLKPRNQFQHPRSHAPIRRRSHEADDASEQDFFYVGQDSEDVPPVMFSKNGRGVEDIRRLKSKYWPIVAYVDLHGYTQQEAQRTLNEFIEYVQERGVAGEIIHGSGLGSKDYEPVLKNLVRRWLMAHPQVLAYAQPHEHNDGAVYVLLKKRYDSARSKK